ncbi:MAG: polyphosphate polymerase domain-containing protein [Rhodothermaceae bacterium]|nr:polyphosphate polymerase domain-containing protein [Rhodothermaceae bacterium]
MNADKLQRQRFENKYVIDEDRALAIRDFTSSFMQLDEYGAIQPNFSYPVHSLYLDSADLKLVQSTINGDRNRFKLRIRFYENTGDAPVYFEIKRRHNSVIAKKRAAVHRAAAAMVVAGQISGPDILATDDIYHQQALDEFTRLRSLLNAGPVAHVTYMREAWAGYDGQNLARLTMDRQVFTEPCRTVDFNPRLDNPLNIFGNKVILELKFTNRYPHWFRDLIQIFDLRQGPAAKYVDGVTRLGEHRFQMAYI